MRRGGILDLLVFLHKAKESPRNAVRATLRSVCAQCTQTQKDFRWSNKWRRIEMEEKGGEKLLPDTGTFPFYEA